MKKIAIVVALLAAAYVVGAKFPVIAQKVGLV